MTVELPQHLEEWVLAQVKTGKFDSPMAFVQNTLEWVLQRQQAEAQLETLLDKGFADLEQGKTHRFDSLEEFRAAVKARTTP